MGNVSDKTPSVPVCPIFSQDHKTILTIVSQPAEREGEIEEAFGIREMGTDAATRVPVPTGQGTRGQGLMPTVTRITAAGGAPPFLQGLSSEKQKMG